MLNIFMFASWLLLLAVIVISWRRAEPDRKIQKTLSAVVIFFVIHALIAFMVLQRLDFGDYFELFWSWKVWWFAQ